MQNLWPHGTTCTGFIKALKHTPHFNLSGNSKKSKSYSTFSSYWFIFRELSMERLSKTRKQQIQWKWTHSDNGLKICSQAYDHPFFRREGGYMQKSQNLEFSFWLVQKQYVRYIFCSDWVRVKFQSCLKMSTNRILGKIGEWVFTFHVLLHVQSKISDVRKFTYTRLSPQFS